MSKNDSIRIGQADLAMLRRYVDDQLEPQDEAELLARLEQSPELRDALERTADLDWWQSVRGDFRAGELDASGSSRTEPGQEVLQRLAPSEDPSMLGRIGHYEVQGIVGQGSTGVVLKAMDPRLNRTVAIKVLAPTVTTSGAARRRFEREARAVAAVAHDHVVPIYSVDEHDGLPFIVMQYVSGASLRVRLHRDGPLSTREAARVGLQIARALGAAHAQGIVHRDVKPANVLVEGTVDRVMVTDFGLASVADEASVTHSGTIHGTPQYMSPEQARGESVDARTDLFSLGSLLYEACTGRAPFSAQTVIGVIHRVNETEPTPIREVNTEIDEWLEAFIAKLMSKDLATRFQTADEVSDLLAGELAFLQNPTGTERPTRLWWDRPAISETRPWPLVTLGIVGFAIGIGGGLAWLAQGQPGGQASEQPANEPTGQFASSGDGATASSDGVLRKSFPMESGGLLTVDVAWGAITVLAADVEEVTLEVSGVEVDGDGPDAVLLEQAGVQLEVSDEGVVLTGPARNGEMTGRGYTVTVPADTDLNVVSGSGDVIVGSIQGDVRVETLGGGIALGHVAGDVNARSHMGDITMLSGCDGNGNLVAILGSVAMAGITGDAFAITSGGDVWLGESPGSIGAQTSGGSVYIDGVLGSLRTHATGGDVVMWVPQEPLDDVRVNAADGSVVIVVADDVDTRIEASGDLRSSMFFVMNDIVDDEGASWATSTLNEGGRVLRGSASSGQIYVDTIEKDGSMTFAEALESVGWQGVLPFAYSGRYESKNGGPSGSGQSLGGSGSGQGQFGRSGLGQSGFGQSGFGQSGLGQSGVANSVSGQGRANGEAQAGTLSSARPGRLTTVRLDDPDAVMDGYTIYLPQSHGPRDEPYPIIVYLQGAFGVGDRIEAVNEWGLARLLRDETSLDSRRNRLLLDEFIVVNPHIRSGQYGDYPSVVREILDEVIETHNADPTRIYVTGLSRGGHGSWALAEALPSTFAAIAPIGGSSEMVEDWSSLSGTSVWISHNAGDSRVSFNNAQRAMNQIEGRFGVQFRRFDRLVVEGTDYLDHDFILTSARTRSHDAWTEVYSNAEFYEWLLRQRRD
ncbi:MAG: protein kinase [Planctomycetota bacterium]